MSEKPVFNINQKLFDKLVDWQQKIEEKNQLEAEAEAAEKAKKPTSDAKEK